MSLKEQKMDYQEFNEYDKLKFLNPIRFSYQEFNEYDKLKFGDNLLYFLS
jgi:hypothetical protein